GDLGDVAHLGGEVAGHRVDRVGQVLPRAGDTGHLGLAAELALGAHLAGHAGHLRGEGVELLDHRVDGALQLGDLALGLDRDLPGQVALRHGRGDVGDVAHLVGQVAGHEVHVLGEALPGPANALDVGLTAEAAFRPHFAGHAGDLGGEGVELVDHGVDRVLQLEDLAPDVDRDLLGQVALGHRRGHLGDVAHLGGQVAGHRVDRVGQVLPRAGHTGHLGLTAELALGAHLAGHAGHLRGEGVELLDHRVDGALQLGDLALGLDRDLPGQVALRHGRGDVGDVAHLVGQVAGHEVDVLGEALPGPTYALDVGLAAEAALRPHLAGHAGDLGGEGVELVDHGVDRVLELEDLAPDIDRDLLGQVALGHRRGHLGDVADLGGQVAGHRVDRVGQVLPRAGDAGHLGLAAELALGAHLARHAGHLRGERVELLDHRVDGALQLGDLALGLDRDLPRQVALCHGR